MRVEKGAMVFVPHGFGSGVVQSVEEGQAVVMFEDGDRRLFAPYLVEELRPAGQEYRHVRVRPPRNMLDGQLLAYVHESGVMAWFTEAVPQIPILPRDAYAFEGGVKIIGD